MKSFIGELRELSSRSLVEQKEVQVSNYVLMVREHMKGAAKNGAYFINDPFLGLSIEDKEACIEIFTAEGFKYTPKEPDKTSQVPASIPDKLSWIY